jgi:hypothetical protein
MFPSRLVVVVDVHRGTSALKDTSLDAQQGNNKERELAMAATAVSCPMSKIQDIHLAGVRNQTF